MARSQRARAPIFRFERVHDISAGDRACERSLLQTFLDDSASRVTRIRAAFARSDAAHVADEAHSLLGACGTLGTVSMVDFCRELETRAKLGPLPRGRQMLANLEREHDDLRRTVEGYLESLE